MRETPQILNIDRGIAGSRAILFATNTSAILLFEPDTGAKRQLLNNRNSKIEHVTSK